MFVDESIDPWEIFQVILTSDEQLSEQMETRAICEFRLIYSNLSIEVHSVDMRQLSLKKNEIFLKKKIKTHPIVTMGEGGFSTSTNKYPIDWSEEFSMLTIWTRNWYVWFDLNDSAKILTDDFEKFIEWLYCPI